MYSPVQYRSDLARAWKPVQKSAGVFGKKLRTLDPFTYFTACLIMSAWLVIFGFLSVLLSARRITNI